MFTVSSLAALFTELITAHNNDSGDEYNNDNMHFYPTLKVICNGFSQN